jgi:hypothetical protein
MDHGPWMGADCPHWLLKILSYLVSLQFIGWEYMLVVVNNLPNCWGEIILLLTFYADMDTLDVQYSLDMQYFWGRCHILLLHLIDMVNYETHWNLSSTPLSSLSKVKIS